MAKVMSRVFTKEDPYNVHKVLGFTVLSMYLYRIFVWCCPGLRTLKFHGCDGGQLAPEGSDFAGFKPDMWALAAWPPWMN